MEVSKGMMKYVITIQMPIPFIRLHFAYCYKVGKNYYKWIFISYLNILNSALSLQTQLTTHSDVRVISFDTKNAKQNCNTTFTN